MAQKQKIRTTEWLTAMGAVDTTERPITVQVRIEVRCTMCQKIGQSKVGNIATSYAKNGFGWRCRDCSYTVMGIKMSERIKGEGNPFYGKTHSAEAKKLIGEKNRQAYYNLSESKQQAVIDRLDIEARKVHSAHGGNVMFDSEIRQRHHKATHTEVFKRSAKENGDRFAADPGFSSKMQEYSQSFWKSTEGQQRKEELRSFYLSEFNTPGGKFYDQRITAHQDFLTDPLQMHAAKMKAEQTCLDRWGVKNPMMDANIRRKALSHTGITQPEKILIEMLFQRGINFDSQVNINGKQWDVVIYDNEQTPKIIIEIDGEYHHGLLQDPFYSHVGGHKDPERFSRVPDGVKYLEIDSRKVKGSMPLIMETMGIDYWAWINSIFLECAALPFPYPDYKRERMRKDWENLQRLNMTDYNSKKTPGNSIVTRFHKSIYHARRKTSPSPFDAWRNPELLMKCVMNRFIYKSNLSTQQIARGFERNKIAPRVTVFQPALARYLLQKYAPGATTCVDPFSGYSGRMLGACSLGIQYTGSDINSTAVCESNDIIDFLGLTGCSVTQEDIWDKNENTKYDVLITCPPYGNKEIWEKGKEYDVEDAYIKQCLQRIDAQVYIFVVGRTFSYQNLIAEKINNNSHLSNSDELVLVFKQ